MLRITDVQNNGDEPVLKIEGRIDAAQLEEFSRAVIRAAARSSRVLLDMSEVTFVDRAGVELLHGLRGRGVELRNCSSFIETLLGERQ